MATTQTFNALLSSFSTFLTVFLHDLLYARSLYPRTSFLLTKAYNAPVHQNRHPNVCQWIADAVAAVHTQLSLGTVARLCVVMYSPANKPLERYVLDVSRFPVVSKSDRERELVREDQEGLEWNEGKGNIDLEEQFRATLMRLSTATSRLKDLPSGSTFGLAIELKDDEDATPPIGHPQPWIPVQPSEQAGKGNTNKGGDLGGLKTTPVRAVEAGECLFEVWVEEAAAKFQPVVADAEPEEGS